MKATSARQKPIGPSATSMNGRRRPSGVWNVSDHGPITGESASANSPSAPSTSAISVPDSVYRPSNTCMYVVVVIANASPNAPSPSDQTRPVRSGTSAPLGADACSVRGESSPDHLDHGIDRARHVVLRVRQRPERPAREQLLERAVEHPCREPGVDVRAQLAALLPAVEDVLDRAEDLGDLVDAAPDV